MIRIRRGERTGEDGGTASSRRTSLQALRERRRRALLRRLISLASFFLSLSLPFLPNMYHLCFVQCFQGFSVLLWCVAREEWGDPGKRRWPHPPPLSPLSLSSWRCRRWRWRRWGSTGRKTIWFTRTVSISSSSSSSSSSSNEKQQGMWKNDDTLIASVSCCFFLLHMGSSSLSPAPPVFLSLFSLLLSLSPQCGILLCLCCGGWCFFFTIIFAFLFPSSFSSSSTTSHFLLVWEQQHYLPSRREQDESRSAVYSVLLLSIHDFSFLFPLFVGFCISLFNPSDVSCPLLFSCSWSLLLMLLFVLCSSFCVSSLCSLVWCVYGFCLPFLPFLLFFLLWSFSCSSSAPSPSSLTKSNHQQSLLCLIVWHFWFGLPCPFTLQGAQSSRCSCRSWSC